MTPIFTLTIPNYRELTKDGKVQNLSCVPSWNEILRIDHWARSKRKAAIQTAFLSALQASASASSTRIICARNTSSTAAATLACYLMTPRTRSTLKSASAKPPKARRSTR